MRKTLQPYKILAFIAVLCATPCAFASNIAITVTGGSVNYGQDFSFTTIESGPDSSFTFAADDPGQRFNFEANLLYFAGENTLTYSFSAGNYSDHDLTFTLAFDVDPIPGLRYSAAWSEITGNGIGATGPFTSYPAGAGGYVFTASGSFQNEQIVSVHNGGPCGSPTSSEFSCAYDPANSTIIPQRLDGLQSILVFVLPGSDQSTMAGANYIGWNGAVGLDAVPEPGTLAGTAAGLLAFICRFKLRRRRRSKNQTRSVEED